MYSCIQFSQQPHEVGSIINPHFSDNETETQRGLAICLRSHSRELWSLDNLAAMPQPHSFIHLLKGQVSGMWGKLEEHRFFSFVDFPQPHDSKLG